VFSDEDDLVEERGVVLHAQEAREAGFAHVELERFAGTAHVGHAMADPKRYWAIVQHAVEDGLKGK